MMNWYPPFTLRTKLVSLITLVLGAISLAIYLYVPAQIEKLEKEAIISKAGSIVDMTAYTVGPALVFRDSIAGREALNSAGQNIDLAYVSVLDDSGRVFASLINPTVGQAPNRQPEGVGHESGLRNLYETESPVRYNQRIIGTVRLGMSLDQLDAEVVAMRATIAGISALIFLAGMIAAFAISTAIVGPLRIVVGTVNRIAGGDLTQRAAVVFHDEVGQLANAFNKMVDTLERRTLELQKEIDERKRAESAIIESEERFRQLAENIQQVFWIRDTVNQKMLYLSPAFESLWEQSRENFDRNQRFLLKSVHPHDRRKVLELFVYQHQVAEDNSFSHEFRIRGSGGRTKWIRARVFRILNNRGEVYRVAGIAEDITERKIAEDQIKESLEEKSILLKEIHHRVKNNLQVICSLLNLQSGFIKDAEALELFNESQNRIKTMAMIHERLYRSKDLSRIDFGEYTRNLVESLFRSYGVNGNIKLGLNIVDVSFAVDTAVPCGLIINELVSNALKYAFPGGGSGEISIDLHRAHERGFTLRVADNGVGIPQNLDWRNTTSLGLRLVNILAKQLGASVELAGGEGTAFTLTFAEFMDA